MLPFYGKDYPSLGDAIRIMESGGSIYTLDCPGSKLYNLSMTFCDLMPDVALVGMARFFFFPSELVG